MFLWFMIWLHAAGSSNKSITALKPLFTFISWNHTSGSRDHHQKLGNTQHTIRENIGSVSKKCWMHIFVQNFFLCLHQRGVLGLCRATVSPQALQNCSRHCRTQRQEHHTGAGGEDRDPSLLLLHHSFHSFGHLSCCSPAAALWLHFCSRSLNQKSKTAPRGTCCLSPEFWYFTSCCCAQDISQAWLPSQVFLTALLILVGSLQLSLFCDPVVNQHLGEPLASRFSAATGYFPQQCAWAVKCLAALRSELESSTVSI